jgi:hypothetical protein
MSLVAVALCTGMTIATTNARAEEATATSSEAIVSDVNDDYNVEPSIVDAEHRLDAIDRDWRRRGYGCYSYCDEIRDSCMRRYYRGYDGGHRRDRHRWDDRRNWNDGYRRCERRFDYCIDACRDTRWRDR